MALAIVTGASRGIGRALALRLAADGYTVACIARSAPELESLAAEHPALIAVPVDLVDEEATGDAVDSLLRDHGPCSLLVNNAGYGLRAAVEEIPLDRWRRQFELNLFAVTHLTQRVLPGMREAGSGTIVNISSVAGRISTPYSGAYAATKFALEAMSDALRVEVKRFGVRVILVEPGPVASHFTEAARTESEDLLADAGSPYRANYELTMQGLGHLHAGAWSCEEVAARTVRAVQSSRPPLRVACYGPFLRLSLLLHGLAPRLFDAALARRTGS